MWGLFRRCIPTFGWIFPGSSPIDSFLQGVIAACAISILNHLLWIYFHIQSLNDPDHGGLTATKFHLLQPILHSLHLSVLTGLFSSVGTRVASLVVLEFSLRTISMLISNNHVNGSNNIGTGMEGCEMLVVTLNLTFDVWQHLFGCRGAFVDEKIMSMETSVWMITGYFEEPKPNKQIFFLCQFSLGCGMTASLSYLNEGAPHSTLSLGLSTALAGLIMWYMWKLSKHISLMYELHSKERYCGICIFFLTNWYNIPKLLCNALKVVFIVADVAAIFLINKDFITTSEALRFWTPLTICYTLLVIYMQEEQRENASEQTTYQTVAVRMGGLLVLTLTVGRWMDVVHVLLSLFGEMWCLIQAGSMMEFCRELDFSRRSRRGGIREHQLRAQRRSKLSDIQSSDY